MMRILRAAQRGRYASFPTVHVDDQYVRVFYRLAAKGRTGTHGSAGRVRCLKIDKAHFLEAFSSDHQDSLYDAADDLVYLFGNDNEMDAIASQVTPDAVCLTTRSFAANRVMRNFVSRAASFAALCNQRHEVAPPAGVQWFAFYGHAIKASDTSWLFPAYGCLKRREDHQCSFLLRSDSDCRDWQVQEILPSDWQQEVNECSIVQHAGAWYVFLRQHKPPYGIWMVQSTDGNDWSIPKQLCEAAHAPMALSHKGRLYLGLRHLIAAEEAATAIMLPLEGRSIHHLDCYHGNVYDGGYCDLALIADRLYAFYYHGNPEGEPELRCALVDDSL